MPQRQGGRVQADAQEVINLLRVAGLKTQSMHSFRFTDSGKSVSVVPATLCSSQAVCMPG